MKLFNPIVVSCCHFNIEGIQFYNITTLHVKTSCRVLATNWMQLIEGLYETATFCQIYPWKLTRNVAVFCGWWCLSFEWISFCWEGSNHLRINSLHFALKPQIWSALSGMAPTADFAIARKGSIDKCNLKFFIAVFSALNKAWCVDCFSCYICDKKMNQKWAHISLNPKLIKEKTTRRTGLNLKWDQRLTRHAVSVSKEGRCLHCAKVFFHIWSLARLFSAGRSFTTWIWNRCARDVTRSSQLNWRNAWRKRTRRLQPKNKPSDAIGQITEVKTANSNCQIKKQRLTEPKLLVCGCHHCGQCFCEFPWNQRSITHQVTRKRGSIPPFVPLFSCKEKIMSMEKNDPLKISCWNHHISSYFGQKNWQIEKHSQDFFFVRT